MGGSIGELSGVLYQGPVAHLMVVAHYVEKNALEKVRQSEHCGQLNLSDQSCLALLAAQDYSPGELAAQLGISRQACSKTIGALAGQGLIARRRNPVDSRSSVLSLTDGGRQWLQDRAAVALDIYREFAGEVGEERLGKLVELLAQVSRQLGFEAATYSARASVAADLSAGLNLLLPALVSQMKQMLARSLSEKGFVGLKPSFGQVLGLLQREERRIQYIASVIGVSKQAIAATAADLELAGYITRTPDPGDRRQVVLRLTLQGQHLLSESVASVRALEATIKNSLGEREYRLLDDTLAELYLQVAGHYDAANVLPAKIQKISEYLLAELGVAGVRTLARHLATMTRGES